MKKLIKSVLKSSGFDLKRSPPPKDPRLLSIPDSEAYQPVFCPWLINGPFEKYYNLAKLRSLVTVDRCHVLYSLARQALHLEGDFWECGVYKGGTAAMFALLLAEVNSSKHLFLFDTFEGMPQTDAKRDIHSKGDFSDTSLAEVSAYVDRNSICRFRKGFIPETFVGLEASKIAFAHIDVDIYKSVIDCLDFIWPRLSFGGFIVFDDYGFPTCPGARRAVDEFFHDNACVPLCLSTGQAIVFKGAS